MRHRVNRGQVDLLVSPCRCVGQVGLEVGGLVHLEGGEGEEGIEGVLGQRQGGGQAHQQGLMGEGITCLLNGHYSLSGVDYVCNYPSVR